MSTISKLLPLAVDNFSTQVASATISTSSLTFDVDDASGLPTEGVGQLFKKDADGAVVAGSIEFIHWTDVEGNTINLTDTGDRGITGSDAGAQAYSADDYFEVWVSTYYQPYNAMIVEHGLSGTHDATKVAMLAGAQTITGAKTFTTGLLKAIDITSGAGVSTLPTVSDTLVGKATTDVLTNKTIIQKVTSYTPEAAATATLDLTTGNIHKITMPAGNITIAISNEAVGQCFIIEITQDGTGSRTVTWFTTIKWGGGSAPTLTTTASKKDVFGFRVTGTDTYDGMIVQQNI